MAIQQSDFGRRIKVAPTPEQSGQVTAAIFDYAFAAAYAFATDKIEIGVLPAGARVVDMTILAAGVNGNISVGLMSGEVGSTDNARTCGAEFASAVAMTTTLTRLTAQTGWNIAPAEVDRSIGIFGSADIAAGVKSFKIILEYVL